MPLSTSRYVTSSSSSKVFLSFTSSGLLPRNVFYYIYALYEIYLHWNNLMLDDTDHWVLLIAHQRPIWSNRANCEAVLVEAFREAFPPVHFCTPVRCSF